MSKVAFQKGWPVSQVIVTDDKLKTQRERSGAQEHKITVDASFARFRRNDVTKQDPAATLLGYVCLVLFGIWTLVSWVVLEILAVVLFRPLGKILGGSKSIIEP